MSKISKKLLSLAIVLAMVLSMTPVISFQAAAESEADEEVAARVYSFDENWAPDADGYAWCQACYEQAKAKDPSISNADLEKAAYVQWEPFTGGEPTKNKHYYLDQDFEDYSASARFMDQKSAGTYCWNLNGKTVTMATTTTEALCRVTTGGVLNIMDAKGTGVLAGYEFGGSGKNGGAAVEVRSNGIVNIYGGNFRRAEGSAANVAVGCHTSPTGQINIYGGTFDGVYTRTGLSIKLAGAPVITDLTVATDVFANIDGLTDGAQITVAGSVGKILTAASSNAAAAAEWFASSNSGRYVDVNDAGQLVVAARQDAVWDENAFTTGFNPRATTDNKAYCEACYKQALAAGKTAKEAEEASLKEWTVFAGGSVTKGNHYYLNQNFENYSASTRFLQFTANGAVCWNLNGHSVTMAATGEALARATTNGVVNIMDAKGTGVLTGYDVSAAGTNGGSVVEVRNNGIVNIYGGDFRRAEGTSANVAVGSHASSGNYTGEINIYGGTIDGVFARAGGQANLVGAPQITGLDVGNNATVNIDDLLPQARITVKGSAGTVISNGSTNATTVKNCFTAINGLGVLVDENNALVLASAAIVSEDGTTAWYVDNAAAVGAYETDSASYIQMYKDYELDLDGKTAYVAGEDKTITVSNGTLKGIDLAGEDTVTWVKGDDDLTIVDDFEDPFNDERVIVLPVAEGYKSYNLSLALTAVTLRPGTTAENMGMYYKATLKCGPALAARVDSYGAVLSLVHMPGADFLNDTKAIPSVNDGTDLGITADNNTVVLTTVLLKNIMKQDAAKIEENNTRSNMPVYANAYLAFDLDNNGIPEKYVMADTENGGKTEGDLSESGIALSLRNVVEAIDGYYASDISENLVSFYNAWANYGMNDWTLPNIKSTAAKTV